MISKIFEFMIFRVRLYWTWIVKVEKFVQNFCVCVLKQWVELIYIDTMSPKFEKLRFCGGKIVRISSIDQNACFMTNSSRLLSQSCMVDSRLCSLFAEFSFSTKNWFRMFFLVFSEYKNTTHLSAVPTKNKRISVRRYSFAQNTIVVHCRCCAFVHLTH